jgi:hypothetical protein
MKINILRGSVDDYRHELLFAYPPRSFTSAEDAILCSLPDRTNNASQYYRRTRGR